MAKATPKTIVGTVSPEELLASIAPPSRQADAGRLIKIFAEVTGFVPKVWHGMFGFGRYDYHYESGHSGTVFATGFAMRKSEIVLYVMHGTADYTGVLNGLGPHRLGKSCLYLKQLDGINETALRRLIRLGLDNLADHWPIYPG